jgi:hypothetical protein
MLKKVLCDGNEGLVRHNSLHGHLIKRRSFPRETQEAGLRPVVLLSAVVRSIAIAQSVEVTAEV